jgi:sugar O-acyltransferase (sialic acid O-acetyltransferase NeuD family)
MQKELYILGGSGHALVVKDSASLVGFEIKGYFDLKQSIVFPNSFPYLGIESVELVQKLPSESAFFPAIGDNNLRFKMVEFMHDNHLKEVVLIHPDSCVSSDSWIGASSMIGPKAIVNPLTHIGAGVIINSGAIIEHECVIGNFCHIAPGATILGNVQIGDFSFVGGNAVVKQGVKIGTNVVIGAGSVVLHDIPDHSIVVGNPAKSIK